MKPTLEVGGYPTLRLEDRGPACATSTRWRAMLKGRSAGGLLHGFGPTAALAAKDLERVYEKELAAVREGRKAIGGVGTLG